MELKEAIKLCKRNGGSILNGSNLLTSDYILSKHYRFSSEDVLADWEYEPPQESAFQKWNCEAPVTWMDGIGERRRSWNASNDAIHELVNKCITGIFGGEYMVCIDVLKKIKSLKED